MKVQPGNRDRLLAYDEIAGALGGALPGEPFAHLDNPGHWGVLGYFLTLVIG